MAIALSPNRPAQADIEPRLEVDSSIAFSSDPLLMGGSDREALIGELSVRPSVKMSGDSGSSLEASGTLTGRQYSRRYGHYLLGDARLDGVYRHSERLTLRAFAAFERTLLADAVTSDVDAAVEPALVRESYSAGMTAQWRPSAYDQFEPALNVERSAYPSSALVRDSRMIDGRIGYWRRTNPYTRIGGRIGGRRSISEGEPGLTTLSAVATIEQRLSPSWRMSAELGGERVSATLFRRLDALFREPARLLLAGRAELCHDGEATQACVEGSLSSETSGLGGLQRRFALSAKLMRQLGERLTASLSAEYQRAIVRRSDVRPVDTLHGYARLDYRLSRALTLGATVDYRRRERVTGASAQAGYAGFQLRYDWRRR